MDRNDELERLTRAWNDAWNSRESESLAAFFTPTATYYEPGLDGGPVSAREGIVQSAQKTWEDWPEATFEQVSITIGGDRVVLEWRSTAVHRSGQTINLEGVDILEWEGDKLSAARVYYDEHSRRSQLS